MKRGKEEAIMDEIPPQSDRPKVQVRRGSVAQRARRKDRARRLFNAARWILIIAIAFTIFGTILGLQSQKEANEAMTILADYEDDEVWPIEVEGETLTVGELKKKIKMEPRLVFITNYVLAAIMLGLFFWCRKSPLPATTTALCIYLAVILLNAVIDPNTLYQGLLIKIVFIGAMVGGIKAGLAEQARRRAEEQSSELVEEAV